MRKGVIKHILTDGKFHHYAWVFNGKKSILYVDGIIYKGKDPMTMEYWLKSKKNEKVSELDFGELRISKCARRIKKVSSNTN
jgi:hypothetical protein